MNKNGSSHVSFFTIFLQLLDLIRFWQFWRFWQFSWISIGQLWLVGPVKVEFVDQAEEDLIVAFKKPGGRKLLEFAINDKAARQILREKVWKNCHNQWKNEKKNVNFTRNGNFTKQIRIWWENSPVKLLVGVCFDWWLWTSLWLAQTSSPGLLHQLSILYFQEHHFL